MSTAILISGQLRTFAQCYPTQKWQVYRHFPDPHFFVVVENNEQCNSIQALRRDYPDKVFAKFINDPTNLPSIPPELGAHAPYFNTAPHHRLLMQHWYQNEVWKLFEDCKEKLPEFDTFIRMRGDSWVQVFEPVFCGESMLEKVINEEFKRGGREATCFSPWWGRFGGMNDRMAIMGASAAPYYFTLYNSIESLLKEGCPFHPESLLLAHLEKNGIKPSHTLNAMFATLRLPTVDPKDPSKLTQEIRFPEIQNHEIAEYIRTR